MPRSGEFPINRTLAGLLELRQTESDGPRVTAASQGKVCFYVLIFIHLILLVSRVYILYKIAYLFYKPKLVKAYFFRHLYHVFFDKVVSRPEICFFSSKSFREMKSGMLISGFDHVKYVNYLN